MRLGTNDWSDGIVRTFTERANGDLLITSLDGRVFEFSDPGFVQLPVPPGEKGQGFLGHADPAGQWCVVQAHFIEKWNGKHWVEALSAPKTGEGVTVAGAGLDGSLLLVLPQICNKSTNQSN